MSWVLRDCSKIGPDWVQYFLKEYGHLMSSLFIKESSKHL
ncbi:DNA alkylation repair protein [Streptococcus criceti]